MIAVKMGMIPLLSRGPFGLDLEKSVKYVIHGFKGISCGVILATSLALIMLIIDYCADDNSPNELVYIQRTLLVCICVCGFSIAYFCLCSYLYKGVEEHNRTWIFPWFLVTTLVGFVLILLFFTALFYGFGLVHIILPFLIVLIFYSDLLVYSYYINLSSNYIADTTPTQVVPT